MLDDHARLFVTLWPGEPARESLRAYRDGWQWPNAVVTTSDAKLHLTLHFLGSQPRASLPALMQALAVPFTPFDLAFGYPEVWPHGAAVLAPLDTPAALLDLHAALGLALQSTGIALEDRPFRPHVTLARHASGALPPTAPAQVAWPVTGYALVASLPQHGGYTVLHTYA